MAYRVINEQEAFITTFIFSLCFTSLFCQTPKNLRQRLGVPVPCQAGMSVEHLGLRTAAESQHSRLGWVEGNLNLIQFHRFPRAGTLLTMPGCSQPHPSCPLVLTQPCPQCLLCCDHPVPQFPLLEEGRTSQHSHPWGWFLCHTPAWAWLWIQKGFWGLRGCVLRCAEQRDQLFLVPLQHHFSAGIRPSCCCKSERSPEFRFWERKAFGENILKCECLFS